MILYAGNLAASEVLKKEQPLIFWVPTPSHWRMTHDIKGAFSNSRLPRPTELRAEQVCCLSFTAERVLQKHGILMLTLIKTRKQAATV